MNFHTHSPNREALHSPINRNGNYSPLSHNRSNSGSLARYTRSPYLQKLSQGFSLPKKNQTSAQQATANKIKFSKDVDLFGAKVEKNREKLESKSNRKGSKRAHSQLELQDQSKTTKFKLPKIEAEPRTVDKKQKSSVGTFSPTLELSTKKKLIPIQKSFKLHGAIRTKAGTNGKQIKINQDIAIVESALPHGVKLYCVCDGHGLNGHLVSAFIKVNLLKHLKMLLKKQATDPQNMSEIFEQALQKTNDDLLNCDINTELSGSTVIAVFLYKKTIYSYNVGDSRAFLARKEQQWQSIALSDDQKPDRKDEAERILKFGGRIEAQKDARGQQLGPLRVWIKDIQMPGLAMTRSFGDKAGRKAGTNGDPQLMIHEITPQDKFIVVASDGIWQYLENQQVMRMVIPFYQKNDMEMAAEKVMKTATQIWQKMSYSRDDITIIIIAINPPVVGQEMTESVKLNFGAQ